MVEENDKIYIAPDVNVNKYLDEGKLEELEAKMNEKGGNNKTYTKSKFKKEFIDLLKTDKDKIFNLVTRWKAIDYDPKWNTFIQKVKNTFLDPQKNLEGKLYPNWICLILIYEPSSTTKSVSYALVAFAADGKVALSPACCHLPVKKSIGLLVIGLDG